MLVDRWRAHNVDGQAYRLRRLQNAPSGAMQYGLECTAEYSKASARSPVELHEIIEQGIEQARTVARYWDGGDLAGAVRDLEAWANEAEDYTGDDIEAEADSVVEVSLSAFGNWDELSAFAQDIGALLQCEPALIVRAMSC